MGIAATLREFLLTAKVYAETPVRDYDRKLEPMVPVMRGEKPLKIHCHEALDIVTAIRICDEFHLRFTLDHVTSGTDILEIFAQTSGDPSSCRAQPGKPRQGGASREGI